MDRSSFPLLPLSLVVESSSSSPRRRALARAVDTAHTHTNPIPRAIGRSRSVAVGRGRGPTTRGVSRVATRRSIHRSIGPTGRSAPARDGTGRRRGRGWVSERPVGLSVGRLNDGRRTRDKMNEATRREGRGSRGGMPNPTPSRRERCVVCIYFMGNGVGCVWGWGWISSRGMVWWCGGD